MVRFCSLSASQWCTELTGADWVLTIISTVGDSPSHKGVFLFVDRDSQELFIVFFFLFLYFLWRECRVRSWTTFDCTQRLLKIIPGRLRESFVILGKRIPVGQVQGKCSTCLVYLVYIISPAHELILTLPFSQQSMSNFHGPSIIVPSGSQSLRLSLWWPYSISIILTWTHL